MPMDRVIAHDPVAKVKRAIRRDSHAGRPKVGVALYDHLARGGVRGAARNKLVTLDAVIAPARHPKSTGIRHKRCWRFAHTAYHMQCARQLAVPSLQRVRARSAVLITETIVTTENDLHQLARE